PMWYLALLAGRQRDDTSARALLQQVVAIHREMGDPGRTADALSSLGHVTACLGDYDRAGQLLAEGLTLSREIGNTYQVAQCLAGIAGLAGVTGQPERGARLFAAADALHGVASGKPLPYDRIDF